MKFGDFCKRLALASAGLLLAAAVVAAVAGSVFVMGVGGPAGIACAATIGVVIAASLSPAAKAIKSCFEDAFRPIERERPLVDPDAIVRARYGWNRPRH